MKKIKIRRLYYRISHKYFTVNNAIMAVGLLIAAGFVLGSLDVMKRNYTLQQELDERSRLLIVAQLDTASAQLQQRYYKTYEFKELAVRERLGLASAGEGVLILPDNSEATKKTEQTDTTVIKTKTAYLSNFSKWITFLFGGNSEKMQ